MKSSVQIKTIIPLIFIVITFASVGFLAPSVLGVVPAPDGGYPGGNTAEGQNALLSLTTGGFNTAVGFLALRSDTGGGFNTAVGAGTLLANSSEQNTATGAGALLNNDAGIANTANGAFALFSNTGGQGNTATGVDALFSNTTANFNTANGNFALSSNTMGAGNTAIGSNALHFNTTGSGNIGLGNNAGANVTTASDVTCIGSVGANVDNSCFIARIFGATSSGGIAVFINANGKLGTSTSSRRFKQEIKPMDKTSEAILSLKPVTFRYKKDIDSRSTSQFGLVAEDVEKVNPDLIVRDKEGKPYSVRYDQVNAMLLNEFLKAHRKIEEQDQTISHLKSGMEALAATVKEQAAQIQKVSAQLAAASPSRGGLEASKRAPQVVNNP
jgi:hypothetical protein